MSLEDGEPVMKNVLGAMAVCMLGAALAGCGGGDGLSTSSEAMWGTLTDLAPGKTATQSSTYPYSNPPPYGAQAIAAIDGNTDGWWPDGSVSHTNYETHPWWQVDLGGSYAIKYVAIWNRSDCCSERLTDFFVFVSDFPFTSSDPLVVKDQPTVHATHVYGTAGYPTAVTVSTYGRYVRIQLAGTNSLHMAEVQVFGTTQTDEAVSNLYRLKTQLSGDCVGVTGSSRNAGTQVQTQSCAIAPGEAHQNLEITAAREIRLYGSMCLDAADGAGNNGDAIILWPCHGGPNQKWELGADGLIRGINGRCITIGGSLQQGSPLVLWDCYGGTQQKWTPEMKYDGACFGACGPGCQPWSVCDAGVHLGCYVHDGDCKVCEQYGDVAKCMACSTAQGFWQYGCVDCNSSGAPECSSLLP